MTKEENPEDETRDLLPDIHPIMDHSSDNMNGPELENKQESGNNEEEEPAMKDEYTFAEDDQDILALINEINNTNELPLEEEQEMEIEARRYQEQQNQLNSDELDFNSVYEDALSAVALEDIEIDDELLQIIPDLESRNKMESTGMQDHTKANKKLKKEKKSSKDKKKSGFWSRIFGNVKEDLTEEEIQARKLKLIQQSEQKEQQKLMQAEELKAKKLQSKAEKAEKAKQSKELADKKKLEKQAKEIAKKEEKEKRKREIQELVDDLDVNEGKINKVGASIVFVFFATAAIVIVIGTNLYSYAVNIKNASESFERRLYDEAYENVYGMKIRDEDLEIYDKIMTVMFVNKQLNSYENFLNMKKYPQALDSLLKGLDRYEKYYMTATVHGIEDDLDYVKEHIVEELNEIFHLTEEQARLLLTYEDREEYSVAVYKLANKYAEEVTTKDDTESKTD